MRRCLRAEPAPHCGEVESDHVADFEGGQSTLTQVVDVRSEQPRYCARRPVVTNRRADLPVSWMESWMVLIHDRVVVFAFEGRIEMVVGHTE